MPSCFLRPCLSPSGMVSGSPHEVGHTSYVLTARQLAAVGGVSRAYSSMS